MAKLATCSSLQAASAHARQLRPASGVLYLACLPSNSAFALRLPTHAARQQPVRMLRGVNGWRSLRSRWLRRWLRSRRVPLQLAASLALPCTCVVWWHPLPRVLGESILRLVQPALTARPEFLIDAYPRIPRRPGQVGMDVRKVEHRGSLIVVAPALNAPRVSSLYPTICGRRTGLNPKGFLPVWPHLLEVPSHTSSAPGRSS